MKRGILFLLENVNDLPDLGAYRADWHAEAAPNTENALQALAGHDYEAVITDAKFQLNSEVPFLTRAARWSPNTTRIVLCQPSGDNPVETNSDAHQYLEKPCSIDDVIAAIERAKLVENWLKDPNVKDLYGQMEKLPSVPSIYFQLIRALQAPEVVLDDIGKIISEDQVMTAKVLQVVNSEMFGIGRQIATPVEAVSALGMERTKALALVAHMFSNFTAPPNCPFNIEKLWQHSVATATLAQMITREETGDRQMAEDAFTAGILHDVGKLMLAINLPDHYRSAANLAETRQIPFYEAENKVLGANHAQVGTCAMGSWGLPPQIVEAIGFHHNPQDYFVEGFTPATAIHMADVLERELRAEREPIPTTLNMAHLEAIGMASRLPVWREIIGSPVTESAV